MSKIKNNLVGIVIQWKDENDNPVKLYDKDLDKNIDLPKKITISKDTSDLPDKINLKMSFSGTVDPTNNNTTTNNNCSLDPAQPTQDATINWTIIPNQGITEINLNISGNSNASNAFKLPWLAKLFCRNFDTCCFLEGVDPNATITIG